MARPNGGAIIAEILKAQGVQFLFTLCGGHISPILVESKARGIRVVDMRDEKHAVFAADAVARMTGVPGVAAVTAGPGVTNTLTAVKNAQLAQSPLVLFGGATATVLKGRGSLQDIDQMSLVASATKWSVTVKTRAGLKVAVERAFEEARTGVPGPVFVEVPIDLLYGETLVREWYLRDSGVENADDLGARLLKLYLEGHLLRQFHAPAVPVPSVPKLNVSSVAELAASLPPLPRNVTPQLRTVAKLLDAATRPVLVIGSQALVNLDLAGASALAAAVTKLGIPTYLGGTARGLLGKQSAFQFRHHRGKALQEADLVLVAGFPFDFRLGYGRSIGAKAKLVAVNLSPIDLRKNRRPDLAIRMHPGELLKALAELTNVSKERSAWTRTLREREAARDAEIEAQGGQPAPGGQISPIGFFLQLEEKLAHDAVLVVDGGDFVATGSYILRPRGPLCWLDPGVFGTLGVGGGFAVGAALCRPGQELWLIYGDGSSAYSLSEFDTFARHGLSPIAVIGNDGSWGQIARDQVELLGDDVGTVLRKTDYHRVAEGYGGVGLNLSDPKKIASTLDKAKEYARAGKPVCINVHLGKSEFRKGSMSM